MNVSLACSMRSRLRGLIGCPSFEGVLMLAPCNDIHTFGMTTPLDVAFVDRGGVVLESYRKVMPRRRLRCKSACLTIERISADGIWFSEGDKLSLALKEKEEGNEEVSSLQCYDIR